MIAQSTSRADQSEALDTPVVYGEGPHAVTVIEGPNQGLILRFTTTILIGRTSRCNLVIESGGVAQEHARIELRYGRWTVANLNPEMVTLKNGTPIQVAGVADNDILTIGPARLCLSFDAATDGRPASFRETVFAHKKLLLMTGLGLLVLLPLLFFLAASYRTPRATHLQTEWAKELVAADTQDMCRLSTLLFQARRLADSGQDEEAKARLRSILHIECGNQEAQQLLEAIQDKENSRINQIQQRKRRTALTRKMVQPYIDDAERCLAADDLAGAQAALGAALAIDPNLPEADDILSEIEIRANVRQKKIEARTENVRLRQEQLTALQNEAEAAMVKGATFKALLVYRQILELETVPARQAAVRKKITALQKVLSDQAAADQALAQKLLDQKHYAAAFQLLIKVVEIYPEAKEAQAKLSALRPRIEAEAKRLFEEGAASEAQGDQATATARFRAVVTLMPKSDNAYARLAAAKLQPVPAGERRPAPARQSVGSAARSHETPGGP